MPNLDTYFEKADVKKNAFFHRLHYVDTKIEHTCTFAQDRKSLKEAKKNPNISAIITRLDLYEENGADDKGVVISGSPKKDFFRLHNRLFGEFNKSDKQHYLSKEARISDTAIIEQGVVVHAGAVIENFAVLHAGTVVEKNVFVGSHAIVGARGLHNTFVEGERIWVEDAGGVILNEGVQVLSHATVQKPYFFEDTFIGKNTIVSLHANIGHACRIGENCMVAGHAQLAGYCTIGNDVWIGPSVSISHGVTVKDRSRLLIGSVVIDDVSEESVVSGNFSFHHRIRMKHYSSQLRKVKHHE